MRYYRGSGADGVNIRLMRDMKDGASETTLSFIEGAQSGAWATDEDTSIGYPVIDNENYHYLILLRLDPATDTEDAMLSGVSIKCRFTLPPGK
jgi:hypothetical protein